MSREREFLKKFRYASLLENDLRKELEELLAQLEQEPKFNFDLERMKAAIKSPISDVTVDDLVKQVKQEPVAWYWEDSDLDDPEWIAMADTGDKSIEHRLRRNIQPLYLAPPKRTSLELEIADFCGSEDYREAFKQGVKFAEKAHGIGGGE